MGAVRCFEGRRFTEELPSEYDIAAFDFSELLAVSGLSSRMYFAGIAYTNRDAFQLYKRTYADAEHADSGTKRTRRRDGVTSSFQTPGAFKVRQPVHVSAFPPVVVDTGLLEALVNAQAGMSDEAWNAVHEAARPGRMGEADRDRRTLRRGEIIGRLLRLKFPTQPPGHRPRRFALSKDMAWTPSPNSPKSRGGRDDKRK